MDIRIQPSITEKGIQSMIVNEQERVIYGQLHKERNRLSRLDQEIRRLESALAGHYEERKTCIELLDTYSHSLSPHKRLPSELLARIFLEHQGDEPVILPPIFSESPWVLLWVCSRWRTVAQETSQLWSDLDVKDLPSGRSRRAEDVAITWIPRIWNPRGSFSVLLSLEKSSTHNSVAIRDVLAPYLHRMRSISLFTALDSRPSIFIGHAYSFDALESLVLNVPCDWLRNERECLPTKDQAVTIFQTSTQLRKATFRADSVGCRFDFSFYELPWGQLTHLAFDLVRIIPVILEAILRQCNNLVSLTFTSIFSGPYSCDKDAPAVILPHLKFITVVVEHGYSYSETLSRLRTPLLKEVTFNNWADADFDFHFDHAELINMIKLSGASIDSLSLLGGIQQWFPELLLEELPDLARLAVSKTTGIPESIFDKMVQGVILRNLEHLQCFTRAPVSFLELVERQCRLRDSGERHGISTAKIFYDGYAADEELVIIHELYERLKPTFASCGKDITLEGVRAYASEYWGGLFD